jgi:hypothetical protein
MPGCATAHLDQDAAILGSAHDIEFLPDMLGVEEFEHIGAAVRTANHPSWTREPGIHIPS